MNLFAYPAPDEATPHWLADYNRKVKTKGFGRKGACGLAFDVWRDGQHLFRSYDIEHSESLDDWCRRNFPEIQNPDYRNSAWGVEHFVPGMDRWPIPTRAAFTTRLTYEECADVLEAALATAQLPFPPDTEVTPTGNAIRQRLFHRTEDWSTWTFTDLENRISIRAVIGAYIDQGAECRQAQYRVELDKREKSTMKGEIWDEDQDPIAFFDYDDVDLTSPAARRKLVGLGKAELGLTGLHSVARKSDEHELVHALTAWPYRFTITKVAKYPPAEQFKPQGGFDYGK